ncbi:MAG: M18 family aminopeptidase, partial [Clostridia bacterium]
ILSPKLDDLQCAFTSLKALCDADNTSQINLAVILDNEEVGSRTKQGANSTFLFDVLTRISSCSEKNAEDYRVALANSFLVSADNAHALHPNYPEKSDNTNVNYINKGPVIKFNANQSYSTDAISASMFKLICDRANVPYQVFHNRSDMPSGGTLGNISTSKVSINSVDIGIPQFAMHSAVETAGSKDTAYTYEAFKEFYKTAFYIEENLIKMKVGE